MPRGFPGPLGFVHHSAAKSFVNSAAKTARAVLGLASQIVVSVTVVTPSDCQNGSPRASQLEFVSEIPALSGFRSHPDGKTWDFGPWQ